MTAARILVVDDSPFMRLALRRIIEAEQDLRVVGEVADGMAGVEAAARLRPEVVVMDLAMPGLDGIEATRRIMALPEPPAVVMVSAHTRQGSSAALEALAAGAVDYLWKDSELGGADLARLDQELRPLLRHWRGLRAGPAPLPSTTISPAAVAPAAPEVVAVGASTGGPDALAAFLRGFGTCDLPCVIAQHMPVGLAPELAAALQRSLGRAVRVAEDGMALSDGTVALLPGGMDGALVRRPGGLAVRMLAGGPCVHPSVDVLFRSAAAAARGALGVVLTGMGRDGAEGAAAMAAQGMPILAQSPESCVVGGMPRAVIEAGLAAEPDTPEALGAKVAALAASMRTSAP